jgi:hypothetical protein
MANLEDLGIPAWVQAAWSEPPRKGDILFRPVNSTEGAPDDWEMNALVRKADDHAYSEGYRLAGRIVADHVSQQPLDADFLVYPIIFLYRHYVELQLKRLIPMGALLVNKAISEADRKRLLEHSLVGLWALFEPVLQEAAQGIVAMTHEEIEGLGWYVNELNKFDPRSFSARYALDRDGVPCIDDHKHPAINIGVFAQCMERLAACLFGLGEAFREARQVKCEMDDEARGEGMEFHDGQ